MQGQVGSWDVPGNVVETLLASVLLAFGLIGFSLVGFGLVNLLGSVACQRRWHWPWRHCPSWKKDHQTEQKLNEDEAEWVSDPSSLFLLLLLDKGKSEEVKLCRGGKHGVVGEGVSGAPKNRQ